MEIQKEKGAYCSRETQRTSKNAGFGHTTHGGSTNCHINEQENNKGMPYWHTMSYDKTQAQDINQNKLQRLHWPKRQEHNGRPLR
eukprot:7239361-Heterocapsa_arctica.AAC.1